MYNPEDVRKHYDKYSSKEWARLENNVHGRIEFEVTLHTLKKHLKPSSYVLDAGGGPGRYTIELAKRGHKVYLLDISEEQLKIAREKIKEASVEENVTYVKRMDICNLEKIPDHTFDVVLCLGGALSYVREKHKQALAELIRVAKPGSTVVVSVMSLLGTFHLISPFDGASFLENISDHVEWDPTTPFPEVLNSKIGSNEWHAPMTLYTSTYMKEVFKDLSCEVVEVASTDTITSSYDSGLDKISSSPKAFDMLVEMEKQFSTKLGVVDMGQHLIVVDRTPGDDA
jgi:ubiquinone/menaquinone biosynthesis C-methylase UbiE